MFVYLRKVEKWKIIFSLVMMLPLLIVLSKPTYGRKIQNEFGRTLWYAGEEEVRVLGENVTKDIYKRR